MTANSFRPSGSNARMAALLAAFLGWMFDGFEIGLFPVISRPALIDLLHLGTAEKALVDSEVGRWNGVIIAAFLAGAATGGVLLAGWETASAECAPCRSVFSPMPVSVVWALSAPNRGIWW